MQKADETEILQSLSGFNLAVFKVAFSGISLNCSPIAMNCDAQHAMQSQPCLFFQFKFIITVLKFIITVYYVLLSLTYYKRITLNQQIATATANLGGKSEINVLRYRTHFKLTYVPCLI